MRRLLPDPGTVTIEQQLEDYRPWTDPREERPHVAVNFAATADGSAAIGGISGPIGSATDTAMLVGLRTRCDAVMIGAGTMRAERYGPPVPSAEKRGRREELGLAANPLMVIVSGRFDVPWDAQVFSEGIGRVVVFTANAEASAPPTETPVDVVLHRDGFDLAAALAHLRREEGIRALLCEGGPRLHGDLQAAGFVDDLFLTVAPKLTGGGGPRIVEGELPAVVDLELGWLLEADGELFARYLRAA